MTWWVRLSSEVAVDVLQATLARRTVRFRLCEDEAPIPSPDSIVKTGIADLEERRALVDWSPGRRPRGVIGRGWWWVLHRLGDHPAIHLQLRH